MTGERAHYELAAGHDVKPFITALEGFSSGGGMLPEQIWDEPDIPELGLRLGKFIGAAMPLVWAHAEYVKLLRSVTDGDFRPHLRRGRTLCPGQTARPVEIFRLIARQSQHIVAGRKLRVLAEEQFAWYGRG